MAFSWVASEIVGNLSSLVDGPVDDSAFCAWSRAMGTLDLVTLPKTGNTVMN